MFQTHYDILPYTTHPYPSSFPMPPNPVVPLTQEKSYFALHNGRISKWPSPLQPMRVSNRSIPLQPGREHSTATSLHAAGLIPSPSKLSNPRSFHKPLLPHHQFNPITQTKPQPDPSLLLRSRYYASPEARKETAEKRKK